jgi:hypothetical protein
VHGTGTPSATAATYFYVINKVIIQCVFDLQFEIKQRFLSQKIATARVYKKMQSANCCFMQQYQIKRPITNRPFQVL